MKLIDIPFFDWLFPRDPLPSEEEHLVRQQRSKARALSSKTSSSESLSYEGSSTGASAESDWTKTGSWIIQHDDYGAPYWVNDVTGETTYGLYIQQTGKETPITQVENRHPYYLVSPTTPPPSTTAAATASCPSTPGEISSGDGSGSKLSSTGTLNGDGGNKSDETMIMKVEKGCIHCRPGGFWEEKYDKVTGAKVWYHTGTRRTTKKDPFF